MGHTNLWHVLVNHLSYGFLLIVNCVLHVHLGHNNLWHVLVDYPSFIMKGKKKEGRQHIHLSVNILISWRVLHMF